MFIFVFIFITRGGRSKKILLWFKSKSVLLIFSSKSFIESDLTFRSLIHFVFIFVYGVSEVKVSQLCLTLCNPMDYTRHGVLGILQARILEWVAFSFSRGSSQPRDWTQVSHVAGGFFTSWATREGVRECSNFILLPVAVQFSQHHLLKRLSSVILI